MKALPEPSKHWRVEIDGMVTDTRHIKISSRWGELSFGQRLDTGRVSTCEGWLWHETNGGGAVLLPYARVEGELMIGLILEDRPNLGEKPVFCAIGGGVDVGESHRDAAVRESYEETSGHVFGEIFQLPGLGGVQDRLYYICDHATEGVRSFAVETLVECVDGIYRPVALPGNKPICNVRFFPWKVAAKVTPDLIARGAILQLLTVLL